MRQTETSQVVGDAQTLFSCHDTEGLIILELILFIVTKHLVREHSLPLCLGEYSIPSNIFESVVCKSVSLYRLNHPCNLISRNRNRLFPLVLLANVLVLSHLSEVVLPLKVSEMHLLALSLRCKGILEFLEQLQLNFLLQTGQHLTAIHEEIVTCRLT